MSTPKVKTEPGSSKPTTTPPVLTTKVSTAPSRIPPPTCFQTIVTVEVGAERKAFLIHKELLVFYSDYFRGAFNSSFSEATRGKISLAVERVDVFTLVNQFVYTRQLSEKADYDLDGEMLIRCWLFGDKYLMPSLQNRVMTTLILKVDKTNIIDTCQMKLVYKNTLPGSPLRRVLVDMAAYRMDMSICMTSSEAEYWTHEALVDLVKVLGAKKKEELGRFTLPAVNRGMCYYHVHAVGQNCHSEG